MDPKSHPSVAIIIVNWNGYALTQACLISLSKVSYKNFKVILVDNGSVDGSVPKLKSDFPDTAFIESKTNLGFTGGNNLGMKWALGKSFDNILLLNNDTLVEPDFLEPLIDYLNRNPSYAAVQPKIMFEKERNKIWNAGGGYFRWLEMSWSIGIGKEDLGQYQTEKDTKWITGCAILIRTKVIKEIGLLDERFFAYYEDVDWSLRMRKYGYSLRYLPQSKIYHVAGASSIKTIKTKEGTIPPIIHYYRTRNHLFLIRNHANPISFVLSLLYQTIKNAAFVLYLTMRGRFNKVKAILKGHYDGLFVKNKI
ncbi:glycosyltransferase family 2 protein [Aquiflexum sp.]|uniref:glycosyltransferase family 2 protein n=1 Tax=Aquiflexum sp. TaxID=1872584 RepID=UPI003593BEF0